MRDTIAPAQVALLRARYREPAGIEPRREPRCGGAHADAVATVAQRANPRAQRRIKQLKSSARTALGVASTAAMLGTAVVGCASSHDYSHDYSDLPLPGPIRLDPAHQFYSGPAVHDPGGKPGVSKTYTSWDRTLVATIAVLPSAPAATDALNQAKADLPRTLTGASAESVPVGSGGTVVDGMSPDGSKSVSVLLFTEGKTFTTYEITSDPGDPVSTTFLIPVGQEQDARIKASPVS
jgi:hypothetical protein